MGTGLKHLGSTVYESDFDFPLLCLRTITDVVHHIGIPHDCIEEIKDNTNSKKGLTVLLNSLVWPFIENGENWRLEPVERVMKFLMTYVTNRTEKRAQIQLTDGNFKCFRTKLRASYDKTKNSEEQGLYHLAFEVHSLVEKILSVKLQEQTTAATSP